MKDVPIPKTPNCDNLLKQVLQVIIDKNDDCIALVGKNITKDQVILTFDENKCQPAPE